MAPPPACTIVLIMGVAGSGKTTVGRLLAGALGWTFADGDDFHDPASVAKMASGVGLSDADRRPWLDRIGAWIDEQRRSGRSAVVTCSALKRAYRERLRANRPCIRLVYLCGDREAIERRLVRRRGHFFPAEAISSQFADLEPPQPDENPISVAAGDDFAREAVVSEIVSRLGAAVRAP